MRCLLYFLLCAVFISCLKRPAGIEPPLDDGTPPGFDGSAGKGNPPLIIEDPCMLNPDDCLPLEPAEPPPTGNTGDNTDNTDTTDNTNTGGGSLIVDAPAFNDLTLLSSVVLTARCDNCLYPVKNDATELQCEISKGCSDGFAFVARTTDQHYKHQQVLCASGTKKGRDVAGLKLKCTFKHKKRWSFDHESSDEITLSREIVANQHLCVITAAYLTSPSGNPTPEVRIVKKSCTDSSISLEFNRKEHRLALTFSW